MIFTAPKSSKIGGKALKRDGAQTFLPAPSPLVDINDYVLAGRAISPACDHLPGVSFAHPEFHLELYNHRPSRRREARRLRSAAELEGLRGADSHRRPRDAGAIEDARIRLAYH